jgi:hypothetical protein
MRFECSLPIGRYLGEIVRIENSTDYYFCVEGLATLLPYQDMTFTWTTSPHGRWMVEETLNPCRPLKT